MSFTRVIGGALLLALVGSSIYLAGGGNTEVPDPDTFVLGEGASVDPHLYAETVDATSSESDTALEDRLLETTTTEYVTTTTSAVETTTTAAPDASEASEATTATTQPKKASTTTTQPPATTTTTVASGGYNSSHESSFASKINSLRASNGLGSLSRNGSLDSEARAWSKRMAEQGSLSHSGIGRLLPPWSSVAENVGTGPNVTAVFNALVNSSGHLQHMLGSYDYMGIGVWVDSNGVIWTTHIFAK